MKAKIILFLVFGLMVTSVIDAQVIDIRDQKNNFEPLADSNNAPFFYAEILSTESADGMNVRIDIDKEYRNYFPSKEEQKAISAILTQRFDSALRALNFMSMNGWEFVDRATVQRERTVEQRILLRKPSGLLKVAPSEKKK